MEINSESLRFILGIKIKQFRQNAGLSLKQLSERTQLSVSYLSEIEKGKKYPKPEKIVLLAHALNRTFDELVSLQLDDDLNPLSALLNSPVLKDFPLQQFGIGLSDVFDLVNDSPSKAGAFVRTLLEISRGYDMNVEHFLLASLRSYQKMHHNYFEELEAAANDFRVQNRIPPSSGISQSWLEALLRDEFQCRILYDDFNDYPELTPLRSISPSPKKIMINSRLQPQQKKFILARELGYRILKLKERAQTSSWVKVETFDQIFNNFKASYFAGALLIPEQEIAKELGPWLQNHKFDGEALYALMVKYDSTPEMFLYRMSQVMPSHFGVHKLHYMRLNHDLTRDSIHITKELNLTNVFIPRSIGPGEHQCRRWAATASLKQLASETHEMNDVQVSAQRSTFVERGKTFFNIAVVRSKSLGQQTNTGMTLGFLIDDTFKGQAGFWNDADVPDSNVNETCERCPLSDCESRVAEPTLFNTLQQQKAREDALDAFMTDHQA
ncbi:helix-turn-helix domain-containing protein [Reinekea blandensis]|uniref:Transcriptional regulator, putative n=1 Tax=Reinekea blandensis MED297 TaxID=314283 RepID=A4BKD9_9GAMM|nr:XRE family transcriptional regulator [Reinekea blandensis]EAR07386.1 transcriptional regulator, putative [Reinekea sp. MED297] [Reinekea blandensis MED297]